MNGSIKVITDYLSKVIKNLVKSKLYIVLKKKVFILGTILFSTYILASATASFSVPFIMKSFGRIKMTSEVKTTQTIALIDRPNYHNVKKTILERNIFNAEGTYPDEEEENEEEMSDLAQGSTFNEEGPCMDSTLKITLVGTIYFEDAQYSMATIKDPEYVEVDVYKEGEEIIGNEGVIIHRIGRNKVILNNNGRKECISIDLGIEGHEESEFSQKKKKNKKPKNVESGENGVVILESDYVEKELGDGFGNIIQAARLVPFTEGNNIEGFKIFAIKGGSMLDKVGLKNGDIITQVNDTVMRAENGFALYQSFLDERDIAINVLRGNKPQTLRIQIK